MLPSPPTARRRLPRGWWLLLLVLLGLVPRPSHAHEFRPAVLSLRRLEPGVFAWQWQPAFDARKQVIEEVTPRFPEHCTVQGSRLDCGGRGLGELSIDGLSRHPVDVVVRVQWSDDRERTVVLHGDRDRVDLGDGSEGQPWWSLVGTYTELGIEHILIGLDHVLFVLGLLLLVGWRRRLLWAITGFTAAHSLTLAASTLGWASLPQGPVEAVIALSIVLLATEIVRDQPSAPPREPTLTQRLPGVVAFAFGLLHGFGFAGALQEVGIPPDRAPLSLLGFNLGVELGQLAIVLAAGLVGLVARRLPRPDRWRLVAAYAGGTVAAAWTIERVAGLL